MCIEQVILHVLSVQNVFFPFLLPLDPPTAKMSTTNCQCDEHNRWTPANGRIQKCAEKTVFYYDLFISISFGDNWILVWGLYAKSWQSLKNWPNSLVRQLSLYSVVKKGLLSMEWFYVVKNKKYRYFEKEKKSPDKWATKCLVEIIVYWAPTNSSIWPTDFSFSSY